jgi:hypothetical protein
MLLAGQARAAALWARSICCVLGRAPLLPLLLLLLLLLLPLMLLPPAPPAPPASQARLAVAG